MKQRILAAIATAAILFPLFGYVYLQGRADGVADYKRSKSFQLTLDSMYRFGQLDCKGDEHAHH